MRITKILIVLLISLVMAQFSFADSRQAERIEKHIALLNNGAGATMNDISFSCHNPKADKPILTVKTLNQCLECEDCSIQMETFLAESFLLISEVWFQAFGSYRMNIINRDSKLVFIVNSKHQLMKPMPLPRDYL